MTESVKRTIEIEEFTNLYLIHPLSGWLVPHFAALKVTPNMVSLSGMLCGGLSGWAYYHYQYPVFALTGFFLMFVWHVMDGADGQLARLTNSQSEFGQIIDGLCDYVTFFSVYVGLALAIDHSMGWILMALAAASHAVQASAYELQRQQFDHWGQGKKSAFLPGVNERPSLRGEKNFVRGIIALLMMIYTSMQYGFAGLDHKLQKKLGHAEKTDEFRARYRHHFAPIVKSWAVLCANYRTLAIFIACIIGQPVLYFIFEIVVLNFGLFILIRKQKIYNARFEETLE